jgi:hypothetical protein
MQARPLPQRESGPEENPRPAGLAGKYAGLAARPSGPVKLGKPPEAGEDEWAAAVPQQRPVGKVSGADSAGLGSYRYKPKLVSSRFGDDKPGKQGSR